MRWLLAAAALVAGACFEDRYRCTTDAQCDLGEGGRCEENGYCTSHDLSCTTNRRYLSHAGELSSTCFDDREVLANACAGGQGPARPEGCFADVCARLPACCDVGWTDACVQVAQEECDLACDTRIAITANRGTTTELWTIQRPHGAITSWKIDRVTALGAPVAWVAPAPGTSEPRLAGTAADTLVIGERSIDVGAGRTYQAITSVSFDRDQRDTIAAGYSTASGNAVEVWKLDDLSVRDVALPGSQQLTWGDQNRDGFPDAVARNGGTYSFLENLGDAYTRKLSNQTAANTTGGATPGAPAIRAIDWLDFNRDGELDLVVFGSSVRIHTNADGLRDVAERELDCAPPTLARACEADPEPDLEAAAFGGGVLPTRDEPAVIISVFPGRKLHRAREQGDAFIITPLPFPGDSCRCDENCNNQCPGANCSCNYDCNMCVPVLAVIARELDGDRRLDLIAIDGKLAVYTALAAENYAWSIPTAIPTTFPTTFNTVNVSVSGAPTP